jgi:signal transduction histidine kinase
MNKSITQRINDFKTSLDALEKKVSNTEGLPADIQLTAFEDIQSLIEELNVAMEELQAQNDELQIQRQLIEVERERYKELFDFAPDGYLVTDKFSTIREANRAACLMLNVQPKRLIGKPLALYIEQGEAHDFRAFVTTLTPGNVQGFIRKEYLIQPRDAEPFPASLTVALSPGSPPEYDNDYSLRWMMRDISDVRLLMKKLQMSNEDLEQRVEERTKELVSKNKELQDFAFAASHDLEEPLRKVRVFGGMIKDNYGSLLPENAADYLERMIKANDRMSDMLEGLLNYSRITTQARSFELTDLDKVLDGVLFDLELIIEKSQASIERSELPIIEADADQMRQLLQNLVMNALKFHEPEESPQVKIWAEDGQQDQVTLKVQDHGIGFSEAMREEIFHPFRRLNPRTAYDGSGMGLAVCHKIVERHNGQIWAESQPYKGATFTVVLPRQQPNQNNSQE